jgi:hypothetical protein
MTKRVSIDEMMAKRHDAMRGTSLQKAFRSPPSWNEDARSATFVMSTEQVDRYGDIVVQEGLDIAEFLQNPAMLLFHNSRDWPAGQWSNVQKMLSGRPKRTVGDAVFVPEGTTGEADRAARLVALGVIRTCSIGFGVNWDEAEPILDDEDSWTGGIRFNKTTLYECSIVPVPANPGAMAKGALASGDMALCRDFIAEILDNWEKSPAGLIVPRHALEDAHKEVDGERTTITVKVDADEAGEIIRKAGAEIMAAVKEENASIFDRIKKFFARQEKETLAETEKQVEEAAKQEPVAGSAAIAAETMNTIKAARAKRQAA